MSTVFEKGFNTRHNDLNDLLSCTVRSCIVNKNISITPLFAFSGRCMSIFSALQAMYFGDDFIWWQLQDRAHKINPAFSCARPYGSVILCASASKNGLLSIFIYEQMKFFIKGENGNALDGERLAKFNTFQLRWAFSFSNNFDEDHLREIVVTKWLFGTFESSFW